MKGFNAALSDSCRNPSAGRYLGHLRHCVTLPEMTERGRETLSGGGIFSKQTKQSSV